jgi:hypothetical protein
MGKLNRKSPEIKKTKLRRLDRDFEELKEKTRKTMIEKFKIPKSKLSRSQPIVKKKGKLNRRQIEQISEKPKRKLKKLTRKEQIAELTQQLLAPEIKPRKIKRKLNRRSGIIYTSIDKIICYVCGEEIKQEQVEIVAEKSRIIRVDGKRVHVEAKKTRMDVPPLLIGQTKEGIAIYRHRTKDGSVSSKKHKCSPLSEKYIQLLFHNLEKDVKRACIRGQKMKEKFGEIEEIEEIDDES